LVFKPANVKLRDFIAVLAVGMSLLLGHSLFHLYDVITERQHRDLVLATGHEAQATVRNAAGIESVTLQWVDRAGRTRSADAATGKPFARQAREKSGFPGSEVAIKYVDAPSIAPVILSEVAERERQNAFWFWTDGYLAVVIPLLSALGFAMFLVGRRVRSDRR
jgi:hypothetical protein